MNFLAHLYLGRHDPELLVGNLMGDFVKGRLEMRYPVGIERGIMMHRHIDSFAGRHPLFRSSKRRIDEAFGHYRGVLVDLFYDHFLASEWERYADTPLKPFLLESFAILKLYEPVLPERLRSFYPIILHDLIPSYVNVQGVERALVRMSSRVKRDNPLGNGGGELRRHYRGLKQDFQEFLPEMVRFSQKMS